jgi:hypothetical protein
MDKHKYMSVKEFREKGYLQELNRRFLHPLGLALETSLEKDGTERLGGIQDCRDDQEGIVFNTVEFSKEKKIAAWKKWCLIQDEMNRRATQRRRALGFFIEPVDQISFEERERNDG